MSPRSRQFPHTLEVVVHDVLAPRRTESGVMPAKHPLHRERAHTAQAVCLDCHIHARRGLTGPDYGGLCERHA